MPQPRKYDYLWVLQGDYGQGWEDLAAEDKSAADGCDLQRIRQTRREYIENEGGTYRIISRRVPVSN
jgi:hypothetical protein